MNCLTPDFAEYEQSGDLDDEMTSAARCVTCGKIFTYNEFEEDIDSGAIVSVDKPSYCIACEQADLDAETDWLDDTDGNYKSWLCKTCGEPAYDCR